MYNQAFIEFLAQNIASAENKDEKAIKMYHDYLDQQYGKLSENASDNSLPAFKNEHARRQFTIVADSTVRAYRTGRVMDASTTASTGVNNATLGIPRVILPLLRRIMPNLFIQNIVNIQALTAPDAKIFFYKAKKHDGNEIGDKTTFDRTYANKAEGLTANNVTMALSTDSITTSTKKLAAQFTYELMVAADAYLGLDVEKELVRAKADEIGLELEADVLNMIYASASAGNVDWHSTAPAGDTTSTAVKDYNKTIYTSILQASNLILKACYVPATWIICGVDFYERIAKLEDFKVEGAGVTNGLIGRQFMGTLSGKWSIYIDPFFVEQDKALLGFKSPNNEFFAGAMFCPYVPAFVTPTVLSPTDFIYSKGMLSWNGMKMLTPQMYATVTVIA